MAINIFENDDIVDFVPDYESLASAQDDRYLTDPEWDEVFDFAMGRDIDGLADLGCGD